MNITLDYWIIQKKRQKSEISSKKVKVIQHFSQKKMGLWSIHPSNLGQIRKTRCKWSIFVALIKSCVRPISRPPLSSRFPAKIAQCLSQQYFPLIKQVPCKNCTMCVTALEPLYQQYCIVKSWTIALRVVSCPWLMGVAQRGSRGPQAGSL